MADEDNHVNKNKFNIPFVCGCRNLGEALRRIAEGAAMIRTKGEAGTGNVVEVCPPSPPRCPPAQLLHAATARFQAESQRGGTRTQAVRHARTLMREIKKLKSLDEDELFTYAKDIQAPYNLVKQTAELGRLPVVNFAAGGIATPADACLMMQLGMDGVFVGSGCAPPSHFARDTERSCRSGLALNVHLCHTACGVLAESLSRTTPRAVRRPLWRLSPTSTTPR